MRGVESLIVHLWPFPSTRSAWLCLWLGR